MLLLDYGGVCVVKNSLFDDESLEIMLAPESWRIVSSLFDQEVGVIKNRRHLAWMGTHSDRHPAREILVALKGNGLYGFKGRVYPCRPGTVFLFDAYEPHDHYYPPDCPRLRHLWLFIFENDVIARVCDIERGRLTQVGKASIILNGTDAANLLIALWNEIEIAAANMPSRFKRAKLIAALAVILVRIAEHGYGSTRNPAKKDFTAAAIKTIQRHVAQNAGRGISLGEAARLAGYSKFHFFRLFKQHTGLTYHAYVDECRLKKARDMLGEGRRKKEIAGVLGFSHTSVFLRWMKSIGESRRQ